MSKNAQKILAVTGGLAAALAIVLAYYFFEARKFYRQHEKRFGKPLYAQDSLLGYQPGPNLQHLAPGLPLYWIFTDAHGVRTEETPPDLSRGVQVLAAGCSVTFGHRVMQEDTFSGKLGRALPASVYNLGVLGYSTLSAMLRTQRFLHLKPKVVVYGLIDDHFHRNLHPCTSFWPTGNCRPTIYLKPAERGFERVLPDTTEGFFASEDYSGEHAFGLIDVFWALRRDWYRATRTDSAGLNARVDATITPEDKLKAMDHVLREWLRLADEHRFELVVVYVPFPAFPEPLSPERRGVLKALGTHPRFHFVDSYPGYADYIARNPGISLCVSESDCHPGKEGHAIVAEALRPVVKALLKEKR